MEIFDESTTPVNYNYAFSSIAAARNKYAGLGRSTASAVLLVYPGDDITSQSPAVRRVRETEVEVAGAASGAGEHVVKRRAVADSGETPEQRTEKCRAGGGEKTPRVHVRDEEIRTRTSGELLVYILMSDEGIYMIGLPTGASVLCHAPHSGMTWNHLI